MNNFSQASIVGDADMLQHSYRNENVELSCNIPAVVFDELNFVAEALFKGSAPAVKNLLVGDIVCINGYTVMSRHMKRERTPATSGFDHSLPWLKLQFTADVVQLGFLRLFESRGRRRKVGTGIYEL